MFESSHCRFLNLNGYKHKTPVAWPSGVWFKTRRPEEPPPSDHEKVEADGATGWVEPPALFHIVGTVMDFEESALETGFTFTNPNEKGRCGCGESFTTKKPEGDGHEAHGKGGGDS
mgnify:CR=1 FL=1